MFGDLRVVGDPRAAERYCEDDEDDNDAVSLQIILSYIMTGWSLGTSTTYSEHNSHLNIDGVQSDSNKNYILRMPLWAQNTIVWIPKYSVWGSAIYIILICLLT